MLTEIRRKAHNLANKKWRLNHPYYFKDWREGHRGYKAPSRTITNETWNHMRSRCMNPRSRQWKWYGGKGIKVQYKTVLELILDIGYRPSIDHSIDRIDSSKDYMEGNCRWILKRYNVKRMRNGTR